ncbi:hypothetical protein [Actinoplanes solisilvae]|uniref:hypothetical protein n=1 Tax=Actinoplanes solisilvae TaxID=2486853 RepID=UPI000FD7192B|nr:hypothetical protein [Actinoplanes solisilvae]
MRLPALFVAVLLLAAACTADPVPAPVSPTSGPAGPSSGSTVSPPPGTVDCAHVIGGEEAPADGAQVVLGAVSLPSRVLEPQDSGEPGWLFAKQGLVVRAGTAVSLTVAPAAAGKATIGWGSPGPRGTTISVPACQGANPWLAFAGGYTVREPLCVPLIVRVNGREERASVSVGARCA